ncbi:RNA 2',3'-cyclic phosphodiesterase [Pseudenhygromyxa sp. WMMC2535]|uniref:RNA 2',3'-cyclic phosphodiesterase n=1 Tax=Pseudenhygromyxa sp. WMMC2535 TaxID=2712867 RepID=UPI001553A1D7|nr:RNA 2',3'-cyclic phosphodiesterase [Pseudenhygromyxa sp. WMMC2535]NVB43200.1 RNA 2',3'-cyclic phosphodiesterase [Pseudenhygromyxa sp. WMMC2535]
MPRLFLGLALPPALERELEGFIGGVPGARWQRGPLLHLTLHFIGELDGGATRRLIDALDDDLRAPSFELQLRGAGSFPPRGDPRVLWMGVADSPALTLLHRRSAAILDAQGVPRERRSYHPHVTVARLQRSPPRAVAEWIARHALYASAPFRVDCMTLYTSVLSQRGAKYQVSAEFMLDEPDQPDP